MSNENLSEKVSVNINAATLSQIDLLVDSGYYSNRSDFINQALRASLQDQQSALDRAIDQRLEAAKLRKDQWFVGVFHLSPADVEAMHEQGGGFTVTGYGVLLLDKEVDEEKLFSAVRNISVKGRVSCSPSVKAHYGLK